MIASMTPTFIIHNKIIQFLKNIKIIRKLTIKFKLNKINQNIVNRQNFNKKIFWIFNMNYKNKYMIFKISIKIHKIKKIIIKINLITLLMEKKLSKNMKN